VGNAEKKSFHMTRNKMYLYEMETPSTHNTHLNRLKSTSEAMKERRDESLPFMVMRMLCVI